MPRENELKKKMQQGGVGVGYFSITTCPAFIEVAGRAGFDFCIVDMEHGIVDTLVAEELCRAAQSVGMTPIVRVRKNDGPQMQRALDIGSGGVQVPQIETRADAEAVIRGSKYGPVGARGLSFYTRAADYGVAGRDRRTLQTLNQEQLVIVHIEGTRGIQNLDEIVSVADIDVVFLGPNDLSQSLGIAGQVNSVRVTRLMEAASTKIRAAGKFVGTFADDAKSGRRWVDAGVQYMAVGVDVHMFFDAGRRVVDQMREVTT